MQKYGNKKINSLYGDERMFFNQYSYLFDMLLYRR